MLKIKNLSAGIDGNKILNNINLDINSGELHVIMGTNGTGKSTLGNILSGKENYQICGKDNFLGLSNGYLLCDKKEEEDGVTVKIVEVDEEVEEVEEVLPYDNIETFLNI